MTPGSHWVPGPLRADGTREMIEIPPTPGGMPLLPPEPDELGGKTYRTLDSGARATYPSGMVRDTDDNKARFDLLIAEGVPYGAQFLTRCADLMTRGADKYGDRNWEKADSAQEMARMKASAMRHLIQWAAGDTDEDHAAAVVFNLIAYETTQWKIHHPPGVIQ